MYQAWILHVLQILIQVRPSVKHYFIDLAISLTPMSSADSILNIPGLLNELAHGTILGRVSCSTQAHWAQFSILKDYPTGCHKTGIREQVKFNIGVL